MTTREAAPGGSAGPGAEWTRFARLLVAAAGLGLLLGAAATAAVDPYWVFRARPPWLGPNGAGINRLLDVEMRRSKPLQLAARPPGPVLVGSSVVYRGIRPEDLAAGGGYNLGLSSLMADELPVVAALVADRGGTGPVAIGLDYFMFTDFPGPPRVDPALATPAGHLEARLSALLSLRALAGSVPGVLRRAYEGGQWFANGFKSTPDYPAAVTRKIAAEEGARVLRYRPSSVAFLAAALRRLRGRDVRLYLSPVSPAQQRLAAQAGRQDGIARWRQDVARAAEEAGVPLLDLSTHHPFAEFRPEDGSSAFWLDNLHFKPAVGRWVLERLGLSSQDPGTP